MVVSNKNVNPATIQAIVVREVILSQSALSVKSFFKPLVITGIEIRMDTPPIIIIVNA